MTRAVQKGCKLQCSSNPKQKHGQRSYVQSRHDQNVKHACFLKISGFRALHEAPVTQKHRAQNSANLRCLREQLVNLISQSASSARQECCGGRWRRRRAFHQFRCAKRRDQTNILLLKIGAPVKCPIISVNLRLLRLRRDYDFVAGMNVGHGCLVRRLCKTDSQPPSRRHQRVLKLHSSQLDFVAVAPRQTRWFITQTPVPPQWRLQIHAPCINKRQHEVRRPRLNGDANSQHPQNSPTQSRKSSSREEALDFHHEDSGADQSAGQSKTDYDESGRGNSLCRPLRLAEHSAAS